ncbi:E1-E2 ATPase-domain-containing protein [Schizophyllum commune]
MTPNPLGDATTTVHISNLHCSSCVDAIQECLSVLDPPPLSVEVSIVLQTVRVYHHQALSPTTISQAIEDAGFDVVDADPGPSRLSASERHRRHLEECSQCKREAAGIASSSSGLLSSKGSVEKELIHPQVDDNAEGPFKVTLSVGGMTCASCTNAVTGAVSPIMGVDKVAVSLLDGAATVVVDTRDRANEVQEVIDDCGFEATIVSVEPLKTEAAAKTEWRTVSLRVDGMYCRHCPGKVMSALKTLPQVIVEKPIESIDDPVLTVRYEPHSPSLTIRTLISTLASANDPPFAVSIHKTPSVEQLSRRMQLREKRALLLRLIVAVVIAIPTFILGIVYMSLVPSSSHTKMFLMEPMWAGDTARVTWALFFLATPVMFYSASLFHRRSFKELRALWRPGSPTPLWKRFVRFGSMNLLVSMGVSVAYFASIALLGLSSVQKRNEDGMGDRTTYFDSVVFLTMFLLAGRYLESYSKARTADAVNALASLRPTKALLLVARDAKSNASHSSLATSAADPEKGDLDSEARATVTPPGYNVEHVSVDLLEVGDVVRVPSGSTPPADGVIVDGHTNFDESSLTGESRLIAKGLGDQVWLGTINRGSAVSVRVSEVGGETMLDNIVKVVREGQTRRAPLERVADQITGYFVPVITLLAVITWLVWLILGFSGALPADYLDIEVGGWTVWSLEFAIAVFVVACPCGIGLAAPTALLVSSGLAAKFGILARGGGEAFEEMSRLDVMVFDKTGTLTQGGSPSVEDAHIVEDGVWRKEVVLGIAAELESSSGHPLGIAIREYAQKGGAEAQHASVVEEAAGRGLKAHFESLGAEAVIGNEAWMAEHGVQIDGVTRMVEQWKGEAKSVVLLAMKREDSFKLVAAFAVTDPLRPEAKGVIAWLQKQGIETWMISGDNKKTASAVASQVGIPAQNVIADVLPTEKADKIEWLQRSGPRASGAKTGRAIVGMVGDGINDAPALTASDVGIAVASGSDVAISSASFILLTSDLRSLVTLRDLARTTIRRVKFNFAWALVYNIAAVPIAAGVIYPAGHARLDPVWASLAMALSSVSVICSSLLLKLYREPRTPIS